MALAQLSGARALVRDDPEKYPGLADGVLMIADHSDLEIRRWAASFLLDAFSCTELADQEKQILAPKCVNALEIWLHDTDFLLLKLAIACLSVSYPFLFRGGGCDATRLSALKSTALSHWDGAALHHEGVWASCVKFAATLVALQTGKGVPGDPVMLAAEGAGLLDRLVAYFAEPKLNFGKFSSTLSAVLPLVAYRPGPLAQKVVLSLLSFNLPKKEIENSSMSTELVIKWTDKALRLGLGTVAHRNQVPQYTQGIYRYLAFITEYTANSSLRKRAAEMDEAPKTKKAKLATAENPVNTSTKLPPGDEVHLSEVFNLGDPANALVRFNARDLQLDLAVNMALAGLATANSTLIKNCIEIARKRYESLPPPKKETKVEPPKNAVEAPQPKDEPRGLHKYDRDEAAMEMGKMAFRLSVYPPLLIRLATRGIPRTSSMLPVLREYLFTFLMNDFRAYLELIVRWLNDEWAAEGLSGNDDHSAYNELVERIVDELLPKLDAGDSRMFIRLLSELPELSRSVIFKLRSICTDPERRMLGSRALKFLIMFKPPVREDCLDLVEELVKGGMESLRSTLEKYRPPTPAESTDDDPYELE